MSAEILRAIETLSGPGDVLEIRALKNGTTAAGYFDDPAAAAREATKLDGQGFTVYVTANPVEQALLARAQNRIKRPLRETTSDRDILRRHWLLVDLDPVRPSGVSATDEEKEAALGRAREVFGYLKEQGWPEPVAADSGNGAHLLYKVGLPNDAENLQLVRDVLEALSFRFSDERVSVDTTTSNAARIWKLYGTTARKGDSTKDRPHRVSRLLKVPGERVEVSREKLQAVARSKPERPRQERRIRPGEYPEFDLPAWIEEHGVPVKREGPWQQGYRYILEECPFNGHTDNACYIVQFPSGAISAGCQHDSCTTGENRWRELRKHYEPEAYERNGHAGLPGVSGLPGTAWDDPAPLPDGLPPVAAFDPEMLPGPLRGWILDISERMQVPADYCAAGAVVVAASLIGRSVGIRPKRRDDWLVVPNIWGAVVGPPAALKSPALAEITRPLDRLVVEAREAHGEAMEEHEADAQAVEAINEGLKAQIKAAGKEAAKKDGDRSELDKLIARQRDTQTPEPPAMRRYKTNDPTVEKLAELLGENPRGLLVNRDELTGWLRSLDKQGREMDKAFYLEAWNGSGAFEIDRIGRGSSYIPALCVSVLGGIQPGPLASYVHEVARGGRGDDGLLQRFQLLVWPDPPPGAWANVDRYPDADAKNRAYAVYKALDALDPEKLGAVADEDGAGIPALGFSREAQDVFDEWRGELEADLRDEDLAPALRNHLAKYRSLMPSLAMIFHLMDRVNESPEQDADASSGVSIEAAIRAASWCEYLRTHAQRLYGSAESPALDGARALLSRIHKGDVKDADTLRSVYRGREWSRLSTAEEVNAAAAVLEDYGWLRVEKTDTGGRPATLLRLHPSLNGGA